MIQMTQMLTMLKIKKSILKTIPKIQMQLAQKNGLNLIKEHSEMTCMIKMNLLYLVNIKMILLIVALKSAKKIILPMQKL